MLKSYPETGSLNCDVDVTHSFFHEVISDLKKLGGFHLTDTYVVSAM